MTDRYLSLAGKWEAEARALFAEAKTTKEPIYSTAFLVRAWALERAAEQIRAEVERAQQESDDAP